MTPRNTLRAKPAEAPSVSTQLLLDALRHWWKVALPTGLLLAATAAGIVYALFEPTYRASAWIQVHAIAPYIAFPDKESMRHLPSFVATQTYDICSARILGRVAVRPEISQLPVLRSQERPIEWLSENVSAQQQGQSELLQVSFECSDPKSAELIAKAITSEYLSSRTDKADWRRSTLLEVLDREQKERGGEDGEIRILRGQLRELTKDVTGKDPFVASLPAETPTSHPLLAHLSSRLVTVQVGREVLKAEITSLREILGKPVEPASKAETGPLNENSLPEKRIETESADPTDTARADTSGKPAPESGSGQAGAPGKHPLQSSEEGSPRQDDGPPAAIPGWVLENAVAEQPEVQDRKALLSAKRFKLLDIKEKSKKGEKDPVYKQLHEEISRGEQLLADLEAELAQEIRVDLEKVAKMQRQQQLTLERAELEKTLNEKQAQLARLVAEETLLQERHDSELVEVKEVTGDTLKLEFLRSELARAEQAYDRIAERITKLKIEMGADDRVEPKKAVKTRINEETGQEEVVYTTNVVGRKVADRELFVRTVPVLLTPYRNMVLASLASLFLPFAVAVFWERLARRVSDVDLLERNSNLNVVGEIARLPARATVAHGSSARRTAQGLRIFEESIDCLRTRLTLAEDLENVHVLAVTSAANHEGKTCVAAQLAVSIARAYGKPTLLIDGDMRAPDIHNIFEIPLQPGLAELLNRECRLEDAIVASGSKHVHVLPAGRLRASPHKLLGNGAVQSLLDSIPTDYHYIIIDTPPILAASESLVLAKAADAALVCAMRDVSRADQVKKACERLVAAGTRPVGTVLNGVPTRQYAYRYGTYAHSGD